MKIIRVGNDIHVVSAIKAETLKTLEKVGQNIVKLTGTDGETRKAFAFQTKFLFAIPVKKKKCNNPKMSSERVTQISDRLNFLSEQSETEERENLELQRHFRNAFYE